MPRPGGNKAKNAKESILVDAKALINIMQPAWRNMKRMERIDGVGGVFRKAVLQIIYHFSIARACPEARDENIRKMIGCYGLATAMFDLLRTTNSVTDVQLYLMSERLQRIEEGVIKWRNSLKSSPTPPGAAAGRTMSKEEVAGKSEVTIGSAAGLREIGTASS